MEQPMIQVKEPEGYLDTPWGSELRDIESRVRKADEASVLARWEFGKHFLKKREGRKQLPHGLIGEVEEKLGVHRREIQFRIKLVEKLDTEEKVRTAVRTYGSWWQIRKNVITDTSRSDASKDTGPTLHIQRTRKELPKLHASDLGESDLEALRAIMDEIERIFAEVE